MLRYDLTRIARAGLLAGVLALPACGKKDSANTAETGSASTSTSAVRVTAVNVGRGLGADKRLSDQTQQFRPTDVIYAVVETQGSGQNADLQARWTYEDGQLVDEASRSISANGDDVTEFHISKPSGWPKGKYKVEILLNGSSAGSKDFTVK
jgi:hypothetical protein